MYRKTQLMTRSLEYYIVQYFFFPCLENALVGICFHYRKLNFCCILKLAAHAASGECRRRQGHSHRSPAGILKHPCFVFVFLKKRPTSRGRNKALS